MNKVNQMPPVAMGVGGGAAECAGSAELAEDVDDDFPVGMRVLVVDDDVTCLTVLRQMLLQCRYEVTTCSQATQALSLLRESKGCFHVVLSDVHMPDMDGFRLLELVGLEMDLPVIMMSADARTNVVMKGIKHGACDYLIKPVRMEELKNIWQHVVRKKWKGNENELSGSLDDSDRPKRANDDTEYASSVKEGADGSWKSQKKRKNVKEDDESELESADPASSKKPRVVWSVELHQQFVNAVNQLGIEQAVPKRILELMNVPGLTRENVASHLQKFRLYLKRISGVAHGLPNPYCSSGSNVKPRTLNGLDFRALAASGQITPQTLAALQDELLDPPSSSFLLPAVNQSSVHPSGQGAKGLGSKREITFGQTLPNLQTDVPQQLTQTARSNSDVLPTFPNWRSNELSIPTTSGSSGGPSISRSNSVLPQLAQQQPNPTLPVSRSTLNVQPSCVVLPSQPVPISGSSAVRHQSPYALQQQTLKTSHGMIIPDSVIQGDILVAPSSSANLHPTNAPSSLASNPILFSSQPLTHQGIVPQNNSFKPLNSQPLPSIKVERDALLVNENAGFSRKSSYQYTENSSLCNDASYNSSCSIIYNSLTQPNNRRFGIGEIIDERLSNAAVSNSLTLPGSFNSLESSGGTRWQMQTIAGQSSAASKIPNALSYMDDMRKQPYVRAAGFAGRASSFPSRFAVDDVELPTNRLSDNNTLLGDGGDIANQENYRFDGML